jgi:hypothetical protein
MNNSRNPLLVIVSFWEKVIVNKRVLKSSRVVIKLSYLGGSKPFVQIFRISSHLVHLVHWYTRYTRYTRYRYSMQSRILEVSNPPQFFRFQPVFLIFSIYKLKNHIILVQVILLSLKILKINKSKNWSYFRLD